jgi:hypothetical protein
MALIRLTSILVIFAFLGCKKSEERACWKSTGEEVTVKLPVNTFIDTLFLSDNFLYHLIPDTTEYIEVIGGENVIPFVQVFETNGRIAITNENRCNFLRSFKKKIRVNIHLKQLRFLRYTGGGEITSSDTIHSSELRVFIVDGGGPVELKVQVGYLEAVIAHGYGDFTFSGNALATFLNCQSNGFCDTRDLSTSSNLRVRSSSSADMRVNAAQTDFIVELYGRGNIRYIGTPNSITTTITGEGELIGD